MRRAAAAAAAHVVLERALSRPWLRSQLLSTNHLTPPHPLPRRAALTLTPALPRAPRSTARRAILGIHTRAWRQPPPPALLDELAAASAGYCGADLKALCVEAALAALRRRYPQIYDSDDKLLVEPEAVAVEREDFLAARRGITPAAHRAAAAHARPLSALVAPCLAPALAAALGALRRSFPPAEACLTADREGCGGIAGGGGGSAAAAASSLLSGGKVGGGPGAAGTAGPLSLVQRPRLLICGQEGAGQSHFAPALLHALEGLPVHAIGLPSLLADAGARSLEEALVHAFVEARRAAPALLFLPHLPLWWATAPPALRAALLMLLDELPPELPLLLVAASDAPAASLDPELLSIFPPAARFELGAPEAAQREEMFEPLLLEAAAPPAPPSGSDSAAPPPPPLPKAPGAAAAAEEARARAEAAAARAAWEADQHALRLLRMALRDVTVRLLAGRRWRDWAQPPDPEHLEFYEAVAHPMDLSTMLGKVRCG